MGTLAPYIIFELAGAPYAIRSDDVQHIEMFDRVTPVPNTAPAVDGVVFSRGQVVPAVNLRVRFGLPRIAPTPATRLIFLNLQHRVVGLIVDTAREFVTIASDTVRPLEGSLHGIEGSYVQGVATVKDRLVLLLDVGAVLRIEETKVPEDTAGPITLQPAS